jgi:pyrophosphatase PpaX
MPRPFALLFDLDGTLADSVALILGAFRHAFVTHMGEVPHDEAWIAGMGTPLLTQLRGLVRDEALVEPMLATYREFQVAYHDQLLREYEGVRDTLALLHEHGHPMALVTSKANEGAHRALRHLGIERYVSEVVGLDSCQRHKPDPEPVLIALDRLGYAPREAIFLGDSPHDIAAGNAAGVTTVAALWGPFARAALEAAGPRFMIADVRELPPLVNRLQGDA